MTREQGSSHSSSHMGWFGHRNHSPSLQRCPPQRHKMLTYPHQGLRKHTCSDDVCRCCELGSASSVSHPWELGLSYSHTHPGKAEITSWGGHWGSWLPCSTGLPYRKGKHTRMTWLIFKWWFVTSCKFFFSQSTPPSHLHHHLTSNSEHLLRSKSVPGTVLHSFHALSRLPLKLYELGAIDIPILQMRGLSTKK